MKGTIGIALAIACVFGLGVAYYQALGADKPGGQGGGSKSPGGGGKDSGASNNAGGGKDRGASNNGGGGKDRAGTSNAGGNNTNGSKERAQAGNKTPTPANTQGGPSRAVSSPKISALGQQVSRDDRHVSLAGAKTPTTAPMPQVAAADSKIAIQSPAAKHQAGNIRNAAMARGRGENGLEATNREISFVFAQGGEKLRQQLASGPKAFGEGAATVKAVLSKQLVKAVIAGGTTVYHASEFATGIATVSKLSDQCRHLNKTADCAADVASRAKSSGTGQGGTAGKISPGIGAQTAARLISFKALEK